MNFFVPIETYTTLTDVSYGEYFLAMTCTLLKA
jgi:hypothetical protein